MSSITTCIYTIQYIICYILNAPLCLSYVILCVLCTCMLVIGAAETAFYAALANKKYKCLADADCSHNQMNERRELFSSTEESRQISVQNHIHILYAVGVYVSDKYLCIGSVNH